MFWFLWWFLKNLVIIRASCVKYGLPDPLQYLQHPWRPDRWHSHCCTVIIEHWDNKLRAEAEPRSSSVYTDLSSLSTSTPMRIWQQAGLSSQAVKHATTASWMYCGTYFTRELLLKMHKQNLQAVHATQPLQKISHMYFFIVSCMIT